MNRWHRDDLVQIRISRETKLKVESLAKKYGYKLVTTMEYLLNGTISIKELNNQSYEKRSTKVSQRVETRSKKS